MRNSTQIFKSIFNAADEIEIWKENISKGLYSFEKYAVEKYFHAGAKALDLGCGPGREKIALEKNGFNVTGADYSFNILLSAMKTLNDKKVCNCNGIYLPFKNNTFDNAVLFEQIFCFIIGFANRKKMLSEIIRTTKPGAHIIFVFHNAAGSLKFRIYNCMMTALHKLFGKIMFPENHEYGDIYVKRSNSGAFSNFPAWPKSEKSIVVHQFTAKEIKELISGLPVVISELKELKEILKAPYSNQIVGSEKGIGYLLVLQNTKKQG